MTTGTFGPMCSSGAFINLGHSKPRIKISKAWLNGVPAYSGIAAVDVYIGATELVESDPLNEVFPGEFKYGGGHVIEDLVAGRKVKLEADSYGTDCYPNRRWERDITLADVNEAMLFNPRNAYQNYNVAVNRSDRMIYTYMGSLRPELGNANYCCSRPALPLCSTTPGSGPSASGRASSWAAGKATWYGTALSTIPAWPRTEGGSAAVSLRDPVRPRGPQGDEPALAGGEFLPGIRVHFERGVGHTHSGA